jgi:hypothetical protein
VLSTGKVRWHLPLAWLAALIAGCSGSGGSGTGNEEVPGPAPVSEPLPSHIEYGTHQPNGEAAVEYILSDEGMWKDVQAPEYRWNFYPQCAVPGRPFDKSALLAAADGTHFYTAPDADCNLLWDANRDGALDAARGGHAFHEHNGRGAQGQLLATPFTMFWFDDNWLASYMTRAYGRASPDGLRDALHVRWRVLDGTTAGWTPYGDDAYFDRMALDGIFYLAEGDIGRAMERWAAIRDRSGYFYDDGARRYAYPNIDENYHLALFAILTTVLMDNAAVTDDSRAELVQHWVSLRSQILSHQEQRGSELMGWRTSIGDAGSLMNTETISLCVLALGADAVTVFEAGLPPLQRESHGYERTTDNVLAAVAGTAQPGYMTLGPSRTYPAGRYQIQFFLRSAGGADDIARLDVFDASRAHSIATRAVAGGDLTSGTVWSRIDVNVELAADTPLEFRTDWQGTANLDVAAIRVRQL